MPTEIWTIKRLLQWTTDFLQKKGVDAPRLTAEILLAHILKKDRLYLYVHYDQPLTLYELATFKKLLKRRISHEPLAYIIGEQAFWSLSFKVTSAVIIPRPETERLIEVSLEIIQQRGLTSPWILDWGTGSGVIAVVLGKEIKKAHMVATDISFPALKVAKENAFRHKVKTLFLLTKDLTPFKSTVFDIIVSNPPYIKTKDIPTLAPEIQYEPIEALDGGEDGLKYIGYLLKKAHVYLKSKGYLIMEIGYNQRKSIEELIASLPCWKEALFFKDYAGLERVVVIEKNHG